MSNELEPNQTPGQPAVYQIRIRGQLGSQWTDWFEGLAITLREDGDTLLTGPVVDQAALHGLLKKVRDLGMPLISVVQVQSDETYHNRSKEGEEKMKTINSVTEKPGVEINMQMKLSAFWVALMLLYIYADIFSLFKPGVIEDMSAGRMGPFPVTQGSLFAASILMVIPAVMVVLSITLKPAVNRWVNIVAGALYTLVNISNLIGEPWAFYVLFGASEIVLTCLIIWYAWTWRNAEG
jgi:small-conductance mechanosensitive channel